MHILSGYPRCPRSFDDGDTTGSFLGLRDVSLFRLPCDRGVNHIGYLNLYHSLLPRGSPLISPIFSSPMFTFGPSGRNFLRARSTDERLMMFYLYSLRLM